MYTYFWSRKKYNKVVDIKDYEGSEKKQQEKPLTADIVHSFLPCYYRVPFEAKAQNRLLGEFG